MQTLREFVANINQSQRDEIIKTYEQFEINGSIGDEPIRIYTKKFMQEIGLNNDSSITLWMERMAFECYRHFYHQVNK